MTEAAFTRGALPCGHPASLLIRSVESDYEFCDLCETRSQRNDAEKMEEQLGARVRVLEEALAGMVGVEEIVERLHKDRNRPYMHAWLDRARAALSKARGSGSGE